MGDYVSHLRNEGFLHPTANQDQTRNSRLGYLNRLKVLLSVSRGPQGFRRPSAGRGVYQHSR